MPSCCSGSNPGLVGLRVRYRRLARAPTRPRWQMPCESRLACRCRQLRMSSYEIKSCGKIGFADYAGLERLISCVSSTSSWCNTRPTAALLLKRRTPWIKRFFAMPVSGAHPPHGAYDMDRSEVALVAAHRAGLMDGSDSRETLCHWAEVHPSSYSARLLLAWRGVEGGGLNKAAMCAIAEEFPEHRRWNEWLCYGFASREQRAQLRQRAGIDRHHNGTASRLLAPYPGS